MSHDHARRTIVVTGASQGIGLAASVALNSNGWHVIGVARNAPADFPGTFLAADLSDPDGLAALGETLVSRGDIRGIVNNFGIARHDVFETVDPENVLDLVSANLRPALVLTQALLPGFRAARFGRVITVTSLVTRGYAFRTGYAAAKSALESLTRTVAVEYAAEGITANAVAPGPTETTLFRANNKPGSEGEARYLAQVPMGRFAQPSEIAAAIAFFASDAAGFITGQTLFVDGGASLGRL